MKGGRQKEVGNDANILKSCIAVEGGSLDCDAYTCSLGFRSGN